jgi:tetratricopeptide (TPR) repeat protein
MILGRFHYARSEYREAAAAFARATARLEPARKSEARYWAGIAWLGLGEPVQARAALEEVSAVPGPRRIDAVLGIAQAWELARRPERALDALEPLAEAPLEESGPAVLERLAALAEAGGKPSLARKARERLLREYPRSIEASSVRLTRVQPSPVSGSADFAVVVGSFVDPARARALASEARRAGFAQAQVITRGQGLTAIHIVRLGTFPNSTAARRAGEQATHALGVAYEIVRAP